MDTYIAKAKALLEDLKKRIHAATAPKNDTPSV